ncbi:hypothetical protein L1049_025915 [Liquidambar formosana]|uniref:Uncharacterized protein n=1 Tax=Liquidambar formosana TaxID=63359 RepID=A0AAP0NDZ0_LIQFO
MKRKKLYEEEEEEEEEEEDNGDGEEQRETEKGEFFFFGGGGGGGVVRKNGNVLIEFMKKEGLCRCIKTPRQPNPNRKDQSIYSNPRPITHTHTLSLKSRIELQGHNSKSDSLHNSLSPESNSYQDRTTTLIRESRPMRSITISPSALWCALCGLHDHLAGHPQGKGLLKGEEKGSEAIFGSIDACCLLLRSHESILDYSIVS